MAQLLGSSHTLFGNKSSCKLGKPDDVEPEDIGFQ
jgi:hypothetical protein